MAGSWFVGGSRGEQGTDDHARENEIQNSFALRTLPDQIDQRHGQKREEKGGDRNAHAAEAEQDGQRRAERRAGGRAQNVRRGHGILKHALIGRARGRKAASDQTGHHDARQTDVDHGGFQIGIPVLLDREDT